MKKNKKLIIIILIINFVISGCNLSPKENKTKKILNQKKENIINVKTYKVISKTITNDISLSGVTQPLDEIMLSPKMSGKVVGIYAKEGDDVKTGQTLIQLEQDQTLLVAYNNAQAELTNIIATTNQDINSAELAVTTAKINLNNIKINTKENIKNAELAVSAAKLAVKNSKKLVDNTKNASEQTIQNAYDSIKTTIQSNLSTINVALTAIGNIIGEEPGNVDSNDNYEDVLGVTNTQSLTDTKSLFLQSKNDYEIVKNNYDNLTANSSFSEIDN
ncbi:MAG: biotin/lipoyl-binding protein, partial [Xanthomonadaceae bacterium]|nr:biotin/lipoyl-binding protein [Rhodospirillaceae bacterium]NIA17986.1 biotin/lipoyl-binding protein [Xanthomonadaceae bacterium]